MDNHNINNNITNDSCHSTSNSTVTADVTTTSAVTVDFNPIATGSGGGDGGGGGGRDRFLRNLNKLSHKISKPAVPVTSRRPLLEPPVHLRPPPPPMQQQPPVYNISKSDFRDVVQKLTGSPAHDRVQPPPPAVPTPALKPASSRLHRIRPPPLSQLSNRPPSLLNYAPLMNNGYFRPQAPLSPLPPLPSCHASAESPISAYMRFLHSSTSAVDSEPKFNFQPPPSFNFPTMLPPPQQQQQLNNLSPKSPCPLLSPKLLCSPTGTGQLGFPQLPISPTVPGVPSPK